MSGDDTRTAVNGVTFRSWRSTDVTSLCRYASNPNIVRSLRDKFPHPYTEGDAERWIGFNQSVLGPAHSFAVDVAGECVGAVGIELKDDIYSRTGEIGYWIAEPFWARGLATEAARFMTAYAFENFPHLVRLEAGVFASNPASARVLEKADYTLEARLRQAVTKNGLTGDLLLYARMRR